jgi:zinc/manganese transport system permease protein
VLTHPYLQYAFLAGTAIAVACGLVGYFLVLRAQVFTGDALSHAAFTGALAGLAFGIDLRIGLFVATVGLALLLGVLGERGRADDVLIGNVFAWTLGLGALFLTLYTTNRSTGNNGRAGVSVLFGTVFGLSRAQAVVAAAIAAAVVAVMITITRPLLFASLDQIVAATCGVPVTILGTVFLALVGLTAAEATQAVGSLLLLGLLATPAGTAAMLTDRPYRCLGLSVAIAVLDLWVGLTLSYAVPALPPSFAIIATATTAYVAAGVRARRLVVPRAAVTPPPVSGRRSTPADIR